MKRFVSVLSVLLLGSLLSSCERSKPNDLFVQIGPTTVRFYAPVGFERVNDDDKLGVFEGQTLLQSSGGFEDVAIGVVTGEQASPVMVFQGLMLKDSMDAWDFGKLVEVSTKSGPINCVAAARQQFSPDEGGFSIRLPGSELYCVFGIEPPIVILRGRTALETLAERKRRINEYSEMFAAWEIKFK